MNIDLSSPPAIAPADTPTGLIATRARALFRAGKDAVQIAKILKTNEARASRLVWLGRCLAEGDEALYLNSAGEIRKVAL